ncbi:hypothetical protein [Roseateles sp.]|uniref:hypothetical protein n=1 Tax=Roseateles sp. TaxID=1971397 RepID=UPI0025E41099|nr:hypothetical protein [Roseateles sp.]MBV8033652.1 hypothetical protein [Roseateles sp.]
MLRIAVAIFLSCCVQAAHADSTVTLCGSDIQSGAGVNLASALASGGRITFSCGAPATININCSHALTANTEIDGGDKVALRGNPASPGCGGSASTYVMFANASPTRHTLRLRNLRILNATPIPDGGITNLQGGNVVRGNLDLFLSGVTVENSYAPVLLDQGSVSVAGSTFTNNERDVIVAPRIAVSGHSSFSGNLGAPLVARGGGVVIADSTFEGNKRPSDLSQCASAAITGSQFTGNSGPGTGGALTVNCNASIAHSSFTGNQAKDGGALYVGDAATKVHVLDVEFNGNSATSSGGAIGLRFEVFGTLPPQVLELHHVTLKGNQARIGGAISFGRGALPGVPLSPRTLIGAAVQFFENQASMFGGALFSSRADVVLSRSFFGSNRAASAGGAIVSLQTGDATLQLSNSLLVKNVAPTGAAFAGEAASFINVTIADNDGPAISGIAASALLPVVGGSTGPLPIRVQNTILSGGTTAACGPPNVAAPLEDLGGNLQYPGASCAATIAVGAPAFGPSYIPLPASPAANAGNDAVCAAPPVAGRDMWGIARPSGVHCTVGASESDIRNIVNRAMRPLKDAVDQVLRCACLQRPSR